MRMLPFIMGLAVVVGAAVPPALADMEEVVAATYDEYSVSPPTLDRVYVCHGFGCKYRTEVGLSSADHARLRQLMDAGRGSAAGERQAVAAAWAWFDRRVAPAAGTLNHVARAGAEFMFNKAQFDCVDASRNTTTLLLLLDQLHLLRHHRVDMPVSRGLLIDGRPPHYTAVLREKISDIKWAVDSWTRGYGQPAEVMSLTHWSAE